MNSCIFCKIINGEIPCKKVYESEFVLAFLDINPHSFGHTLVVPKKHILDFYEISDEDNNILRKEIITVMNILNDKLGSSGITIVTNTGSCQEVKHLHYHLSPKYDIPKKADVDVAYELLK